MNVSKAMDKLTKHDRGHFRTMRAALVEEALFNEIPDHARWLEVLHHPVGVDVGAIPVYLDMAKVVCRDLHLGEVSDPPHMRTER